MKSDDLTIKRTNSINNEIKRYFPFIRGLWENFPEIVMAISPETAYFFKKAQWTGTENSIVMKKVIINTWVKDYGNFLKNNPNSDLVTKIEEFRSSKENKQFLENSTRNNYLSISQLPDEFYKDLIDLINRSYQYQILPAVMIFTRKLLENLVIDILRKKFGMQKVDLFFDSSHNRFHNFNILLKNFRNNIESFKEINPNLNHSFFEKMNRFRELGNSSAHSLEIFIDKKDIDNQKDELEFLIKTLIRIERQITTKI